MIKTSDDTVVQPEKKVRNEKTQAVHSQKCGCFSSFGDMSTGSDLAKNLEIAWGFLGDIGIFGDIGPAIWGFPCYMIISII